MLLAVLIVLVLLFAAGGFLFKWLFIVAAVCAVVLLVEYIASGARSRRGPPL